MGGLGAESAYFHGKKGISDFQFVTNTNRVPTQIVF